MIAENRRKSDKKFRLIDLMIVVFFLSGAAACVFLFRLDLMQTLNSNEEPVGTIIIKNNIVQRRLADRVLWNRIFTDSPVYLGDMIRVANLSTASLSIESANIDLGENTLIRILRSPDGSFRFELNEGNLNLDTGKGGGSFTIDVMGREIEVGPGTVLNAAAGEDGIVVQVTEGTAVYNTGRQRKAISSGTMLALDTRGREQQNIAVVMANPRPNARYLNNGTEPLPVSFAWNRVNLGSYSLLRLEIAGDQGFNRITHSIETAESTVQVPLNAGIWYWRLSLREEKLSSGYLTVVDGSGIVLSSPAMNTVFVYNTDLPELRFQWSEMEDALYYMLQVSTAPDFTNPRINTRADVNAFADSNLGVGTWYWRVQAVFPSAYGGSAGGTVYSTAASFRIEQGSTDEVVAVLRVPETVPEDVGEEPLSEPESTPEPQQPATPPPVVTPTSAEPPLLAAPINRQPSGGYRFGIKELEERQRRITFSWSAVQGANGYIVTLYQQTATGRRLITRTNPVNRTSWTLEDIRLLDRGTFFWQVEAVSTNSGGTIVRRGAPGENTFIVDVPRAGQVQLEGSGVFYGN